MKKGMIQITWENARFGDIVYHNGRRCGKIIRKMRDDKEVHHIETDTGYIINKMESHIFIDRRTPRQRFIQLFQ